MTKITKTRFALFGLVIAGVTGAAIGLAVTSSHPAGHVQGASVAASPVASPTVLSYHGATGQTALALLQKAATVQVKGTGANAYVTTINGYVASGAKKEFWALYINGKQADVGAGSLVTSDTDQLRWQIATY